MNARTKTEEREGKMKKAFLLVLSVLVVFAFASCSGDNPAPSGGSGSSLDDPFASAPEVSSNKSADELFPIGMSVNYALSDVFDIYADLAPGDVEYNSDRTLAVTIGSNGAPHFSFYGYNVTAEGQKYQIWGTLQTGAVEYEMSETLLVKFDGTNEGFRFELSMTGSMDSMVVKINGVTYENAAYPNI